MRREGVTKYPDSLVIYISSHHYHQALSWTVQPVRLMTPPLWVLTSENPYPQQGGCFLKATISCISVKPFHAWTTSSNPSESRKILWKRERVNKRAQMILEPTESHYALSKPEIKIYHLVKRNLSQTVLKFLGKHFPSFCSTDVLDTCWGLTLHCTRSCTHHIGMAYQQEIHRYC